MKIKQLTNKRNNKIKDYLHKSSRMLVNQLVSNNVSVIVIGHNKEWKQDINIGKVNNQKFVQIPYNQFIDMITYKSELLINAYLNGALNILKKEIPNAFNEGYGIEVCSMPLVLTIK